MANSHDPIDTKLDALTRHIEGHHRLAIAFSGGVDSTLLLAVARQILGRQAVALTAHAVVHSEYERQQAVDLAGRLDVRHRIVPADLLTDAQFRANTPDRCYHCKKRLFGALMREAGKLGIGTLAHGANVDDTRDYRPGLRAADEMGVVSPLIDAGLTKADIRTLARRMGLPNWDRPAMACLATRLPYGTALENALLRKIEAAEEVVRRLGFAQCRARIHHDLVRLEVGTAEIEQLADEAVRHNIIEGLRSMGFHHICLDLEGYVSGKMNRGM